MSTVRTSVRTSPHRAAWCLGIVLLAAFAVPAAGCSSDCIASCAGPQVEVRVDPGLAAVEVCTTDGACTRQEFGPESERVVERTFTLRTPETSGSTEMRIRAFAADGSVLVSDTVVAEYGDSECGCVGNARVAVGPEAAIAFTP